MSWELVSLAECCEIVSGATPKTGVADFWDGDIPWVTPKDLSNLTSAYIAATPRSITEVGLRSCGARVLPVGSVLLSSRAPIGHVAITMAPMATNQGFKSLVPRASMLDAKYLYHWLRANKAYLQSLGNGATFKEVSKAVVSRVAIPLPPLGEQRRIAELLDQADWVQSRRRASLTRIQQLSGAIFDGMFGDLPLNVTLGELMSDAEVFRDGDWVESKDQDPDGEVRLTQLADVGDGSWLDKSNRYLTETKAGQLRCTLLEEGDVLVARMPDPLGRACVFPGADQPCVTVVDVAILRPNPGRLMSAWLAASINSLPVRRQIASYVTGTTRSRISRGNLAKINLPSVSMNEQRQFTQRVTELERLRQHSAAQDARLSEMVASLQAGSFSRETVRT